MICGVVLAGGASRRMKGSNKAELMLGDETFLQRAVRRLAAQVDRVVVSGPLDARRGPSFDPALNGAWVARYGQVPIVPDTVPDRAGPLAGVLAAMEASPDADAVVTAAVDTPFFPHDYVKALGGKGIAFAASGGRTHPVFGFWPRYLKADLRASLESGERKILAFAERYDPRIVPFPSPPDPFFNVNTPDDLSQALAMAA